MYQGTDFLRIRAYRDRDVAQEVIKEMAQIAQSPIHSDLLVNIQGR